MPDLLTELQDDLRAERMRALLLRYGGYALVAAIAIVLGTAGWQAWDWVQGRKLNRVADQYFDGLRLAGDTGSDHQDAIAAFAAIDATRFASFRTLTRLREAALQANAGEQATALGLYTNIENDKSADPLLRDLARLLWVERQIDSADPKALVDHLQPLVAPDNAWHGLAQEAQALIELRQDHKDAAKKILQRLAFDPQTPDGVRARANMLLAGLDTP